LPTSKTCEQRNVRGCQRVFARPEQIPELPQVDELSCLGFANDQLRATLDFLVLVRKTIGQCVARVIGPLDDVDQLCLDRFSQTHGAHSDMRTSDALKPATKYSRQVSDKLCGRGLKPACYSI